MDSIYLRSTLFDFKIDLQEKGYWDFIFGHTNERELKYTV